MEQNQIIIIGIVILIVIIVCVIFYFNNRCPRCHTIIWPWDYENKHLLDKIEYKKKTAKTFEPKKHNMPQWLGQTFGEEKINYFRLIFKKNFYCYECGKKFSKIAVEKYKD